MQQHKFDDQFDDPDPAAAGQANQSAGISASSAEAGDHATLLRTQANQSTTHDPGLLRTQDHQTLISLGAAAAQDHQTHDPDSITWWSWRPGIKPRNAVFIGGLITLLALLLGSVGLITLVLGIMDNASAPLQLPGIVEGHSVNNLDGFPRLRITIKDRLHAVGFPAMVSPVVSKVAFHAIHDGDSILLDYSPRLHFLYALESAGRYYMLPGVSMADNPIGSVALLLLGVTLAPYPALLTLWGLRDLRSAHGRRNGCCMMTARVVGKRAAARTTTRSPPQRSLRSAYQSSRGSDNRPGLTPRLSRSWYGVALDPVEPSSVAHCCHPERSEGSLVGVMTFGINYETYRSVDEGMLVRIVYSAHLHYVYELEQV